MSSSRPPVGILSTSTTGAVSHEDCTGPREVDGSDPMAAMEAIAAAAPTLQWVAPDGHTPLDGAPPATGILVALHAGLLLDLPAQRVPLATREAAAKAGLLRAWEHLNQPCRVVSRWCLDSGGTAELLEVVFADGFWMRAWAGSEVRELPSAATPAVAAAPASSDLTDRTCDPLAPLPVTSSSSDG